MRIRTQNLPNSFSSDNKNQTSAIFVTPAYRRTKHEHVNMVAMDESRKRVLGIMAAILASLHMQTADDLFGGPQGSPRSDKLIAASVQWAEKIMEKIDNVFRSSDLP